MYAVLSSSMEPRLPAGSLVVVRRELPEAYREGQTVTFVAPLRQRTIVTHRLVRIARRDGVVQALTKGDANANGDPWSISMGAIIGRQVAYVPYAGYAVEFERTRSGFIAVAVLSAALMIVLAVRPKGYPSRRAS